MVRSGLTRPNAVPLNAAAREQMATAGLTSDFCLQTSRLYPESRTAYSTWWR